MTSSRLTRAAAAACVLVAGLVLGSGPGMAMAASTPRTSGLGATLVVRTVPVIDGVRVMLDGTTYTTSARGRVSIPASPGPHRLRIVPPQSRAAGASVRFARWPDGFAVPFRRITLPPGTHVVETGFIISRPIAVRFADEHGIAVPIREITRLTLANNVGERVTFSPTDPPQALAADRIVRNKTGLQALPIRYSVREVIIDDSNVVYGGTQHFFITRHARSWVIEVLLFPLRIEVRDALFRFPIGSAVKLVLPNDAHHLVTLGPGHNVSLTGLPRGTYQIVAKGPGIGLTAPVSLSKPEVAKVLLFSWGDVAAVLVFVVLFVVGLPLAGGRIVRRGGRFRLPAWNAGDPAVAAPASVSEPRGDSPPSADAAQDEPTGFTATSAGGANDDTPAEKQAKK